MAAKLKAEGGTGSFGAIEVKTFQLPNPGGGADLLEDASCVLVPGHRCVLHALRPSVSAACLEPGGSHGQRREPRQ